MNDDIMEAMRAIVNYSLPDEIHDFAENPPDSGLLPDHILGSLIAVDDFLKAQGF